MKKSLVFPGIILITLLILSSFGIKKTQEQNSAPGATEHRNANSEEGLRAANSQFYAALNSMFTGNRQPMENIWSHNEDVTQLGPFGDRLTGWDAVKAEFQREAGMKLGGKVECKDLFVVPGQEIGFTVCTEEGQNMSVDGKPVVVKFRATNIFRLENGAWKLVHHHTDLSDPLQQAFPETK